MSGERRFGVRTCSTLNKKTLPQSSEALKLQRERLEFETVVQPGVLTPLFLGLERKNLLQRAVPVVRISIGAFIVRFFERLPMRVPQPSPVFLT